MIDISIVIPVFNEEQTLTELRSRLLKVLDNELSVYTAELIFVNDGSRDRSLEMLHEFHKSDERCQVLSFSRNFGHQAALLAGIRHATGKAVVVMDADLQDPPEIIELLVNDWKKGSDVVYAQRADRKGEGIFKRWSATMFYQIIEWLSETHLPRNVGDFRLMDRRIVDLIAKTDERSLYLRGLVSWLGFNQTAVEFDRDPRFAGETKYSLTKMVNLASDAILSFSDKPLRIVTRLGLVVTAFAFSLLTVFVASIPLGASHRAPGWLSILAVVLVLGGVQLICLGIVGEYVSRIYREVKSRSLYIVDSKSSTF
jgi:dolichol-phosphate mannosyltransferase